MNGILAQIQDGVMSALAYVGALSVSVQIIHFKFLYLLNTDL